MICGTRCWLFHCCIHCVTWCPFTGSHMVRTSEPSSKSHPPSRQVPWFSGLRREIASNSKTQENIWSQARSIRGHFKHVSKSRTRITPGGAGAAGIMATWTHQVVNLRKCCPVSHVNVYHLSGDKPLLFDVQFSSVQFRRLACVNPMRIGGFRNNKRKFRTILRREFSFLNL
jgi:hypothetical protein